MIIYGDCLEKMKDVPEGSVDAIITDPPYGTTACKWDSVIPLEPMWKQLNRIIKPNGAIVLFGSEPFSSALRMSNIKNYKYDWVWDKLKGSGSMLAKIKPLTSHENIMVFGNKINYYPVKEVSKKENRRKRVSKNIESEIYGKLKGAGDTELETDLLRYPKTVIEISSQAKELNQGKRVHPTQKPVELMEYLIKTYTNEGETVLDFTMGSGSTGVACVNTNRNFIGIELDEKYFEIAKKRINNAMAQEKLSL